MKWIGKLFHTSVQAESTPSATLHRGGDGVYVLRITGLLRKATLDRIQALGACDFDCAQENLNVLVVLTDFRGWKRGDAWNDIDFFAQNEEKVSRIAVVGDVRWEAETIELLVAGHCKGEVRYFGEGQESNARAWLLKATPTPTVPSAIASRFGRS